MNEIVNRLNELKNNFDLLDDWLDQYTYIVALAAIYPRRNFKIGENNIIKGCQSIAYLNCTTDSENNAHFDAYSDSLIIKGLLGLICDLFEDLNPNEVIEFQDDFLDSLGIKNNFTSNRTSGIRSAIKAMQSYCRENIKREDK